MARTRGSFADAMRTIGVLGALLIAAFFVGQVMTVRPQHPGTTVDLDEAVKGARLAAKFAVIAPRALPKGWRATSARFGPEAWHLGVVTRDDRYIGLEQETRPPAEVIKNFAPASRKAGSASIAGQRWSVRTESDGDRVYIRDAGSTTVLVIGSASKAQLESYVASLS